MNEGPLPPDMIPGIRDLIARLEGYPVDDSPREKNDMIPDKYTSDKLDVLAIMLLINDHDEQITQLQDDLSRNQAAVGFLTLLSLAQLVGFALILASR